MIYTPLTKQAMRLCYAAHAGQLDKSGIPYVFHPIHLAEQMDDEYSVVVALLHDVVEDTAYTLKDLQQMGYPEQVIEAIRLMTHPESMPYMDYVAAIKENPIARKVKLADLRHNSDLTRLDHVDAKAITRAEKYKQAIALLTNSDLSKRCNAPLPPAFMRGVPEGRGEPMRYIVSNLPKTDANS